MILELLVLDPYGAHIKMDWILKHSYLYLGNPAFIAAPHHIKILIEVERA
jgi:hypothetical protein